MAPEPPSTVDADARDEVRLEGSWTAGELRRVMLRRRGRRIALRLVLVGFMLALALHGLAMPWWFVLVWLAGTLALLAWKLLVQWPRKILARPPGTVTFAPDGVRGAAPGVQAATEWGHVAKLELTPTVLTVTFDFAGGVFLPARCLAAGDADRIARLAAAAGVPTVGFARPA